LFFNPVAIDIEKWIEEHRAGYWQLSEVADVFDVPLFKHIYVDPDFGVGFFTSADIFLVDKKPDKFLSRSETKGLNKYILEKGWILLARPGSLGGNIATPQFADSAMVGMATSDHVIRIAPKSKSCLPGYLYAYLDLHEIGYPLILRTAAGAYVPALWPLYLNSLKVLKPSKELHEKSDQAVQSAFEMRVEATKIEDLARSRIGEAIGGDT
jgi:type I restriction enzyme S subunit